MPGDMGYGDFACLGNPIVETPNIDRFYGESVRLTNFHVSPTSAATRAALLTGRHEFRNGVTDTKLQRERLRLEATTIAQVLKGAGYATGIFGKWNLGDEAAYQPGKRGFDEVMIHGGGGIGETWPGGGDVPGNSYFDPVLLFNGEFVGTSGFCTDIFFARAVEWMDDNLDAHIPFFACIMPNAAHEPLSCPRQYLRRYAGKVPADVATFYGMITNFDEGFGYVLAKLYEWGIDKDTLVIFLTDNGGTAGVEVFNAGMRGAKGAPYEGGTHVPSFWRWPNGFGGGVDVKALTAHFDIFPTLAEIAGAPLPKDVQLDGRSLWPLLKNPAAAWPERILFTHVGGWDQGEAAHSQYGNSAARDNRFALVNNAELYDLEADPGQKDNVLTAHAEEAAKLRAAYEQWWKEIQPDLVNENAVAPKVSPFEQRYQDQLKRDSQQKELP
jgi:arylsulfatase